MSHDSEMQIPASFHLGMAAAAKGFWRAKDLAGCFDIQADLCG